MMTWQTPGSRATEKYKVTDQADIEWERGFRKKMERRR